MNYFDDWVQAVSIMAMMDRPHELNKFWETTLFQALFDWYGKTWASFSAIYDKTRDLYSAWKSTKKPKKIIILGPWKFEKHMKLFGDFLILQWLEPWVKLYKIFMKVLTYHYSFVKTSKSLEHKQPQNYDFLVQPFSIKVNDFSHAFPLSPTWFNNCNMTHL